LTYERGSSYFKTTVNVHPIFDPNMSALALPLSGIYPSLGIIAGWIKMEVEYG